MPTTSPDNIFYPDTSSPGDLVSNMATQAQSVQDALDSRQVYSYRWATAAERTAQTGMRVGDTGFQVDVKLNYLYDGVAWIPDFGSGLIPVVPTSVSGTGVSFSSTGLITFSSSSSININGVFDASQTFTDFRIVIRTESTSASLLLQMQLRAAFVTNTSSVYDSQWNDAPANVAASVSVNQLAQSNWIVCGGTNTIHASTLDVFSPNLAIPTTAILAGFSTTNPMTATSGTRISNRGLLHRTSAAYDGFTITTSTGTASGTIRIYGYR